MRACPGAVPEAVAEVVALISLGLYVQPLCGDEPLAALAQLSVQPVVLAQRSSVAFASSRLQHVHNNLTSVGCRYETTTTQGGRTLTTTAERVPFRGMTRRRWPTDGRLSFGS